MAGETHGFIRVPPDSTGKRLVHSVMMEFSISNVTTFPSVGETVTFGTSTHWGYFSTVEITGISTCDVHISLKDPIPDSTLLILAEDVLQSGISIGKVATVGSLFYYNQSVIAGGVNNINTMNVDELGAASVRFDGGSPSFDSVGRVQVSNLSTIAEYSYRYDGSPDKFTTVTANGATSAFDLTKKAVVLTCPTTTGAKVTRRTNMWHHSQYESSQSIEMTVLIGDNGKANVTRRFGYYSDESGIRLELTGTLLKFVFRSSAGGTLQEITSNQSNWTYDRLDGSNGEFNRSGLLIDLTKINTFWFDMHNTSIIRCGIYYDELRILCHEFKISNVLGFEFRNSMTQPLTWEQENTGTAASTSEMLVYASSIAGEGELKAPYKTFGADNGVSKTVASDTVYVPLFSGRAKQLFKTLSNRKHALPCEMDVISTTSPIIIEMVKNATLTGATWAVDPGVESSMEADIAATLATDGIVICSHIVKDAKTIDLSQMFSPECEVILRKAVITDSPDVYTFRAKTVTNATTTSVRIAVNWKEM